MSRANLRAGLALSVVAVLLGGACKRNHPPSIPDVTGRFTYRPGDTVRLSATAVDLDDDSLSYLFAWVDSSSAVWTDYYPNGAAGAGSHAYAQPDTYFVKVKAQDIRGAGSDWSAAETLRVGLFAPGIPACPAGPSAGVTAETIRYSTSSSSPYGERVLIEYDWGGLQGGWCPAVPSDSACVGAHVFYLPGTYHIRARAGDTTGLCSAWSDSLAVTVTCHDTTPPSVSIVSPADGDSVRRGAITVKAVAGDDQIVTRVEFTIDGAQCGSDSSADGDTFSYRWSDTTAQIPNRNIEIVATAYDAGGNQVSATISVFIKSDLKWYWQNPEQGAMSTSALVAGDGMEEVVLSSCWDDYKFYSIAADLGTTRDSAMTRWAEYDFVGHPALCAATGHVIVGSEEGELYALTLPGLSRAWRWPDVSSETLEPFSYFGAPGISGNIIYVGGEDGGLCKFTDNGASVTPGPVYAVHGATVVDAPVIDADGSVYFGTDSGYLTKIDANLTAPIWRAHLLRVGEVYGPIIGSDGTVYCGTDSSRLYAIDPDGGTRWSAALDGIGARPALGRSALFVGTDFGTIYSFDPVSGAIKWQASLVHGAGFYTTPIVTANGYVYFQDDENVLYCVNQTDGTLIWTCDCSSYLPSSGGHRPSRTKKPQLTDYDPNPSITAGGDIIVVGWDALFCINGYKDGQLDAGAPWPKWQKDLSNSGKR
jgi:outer membrane protein assembly factor BamB